MINSIYFYRKLKKKQSLMYQIMIILMEEHKKARLAKNDYIGIYDGGDSLTFDKESWKKMKKKIKAYITINYKETFSMMYDSHIIGLFPENENILCSLRMLDISTSKKVDFKDEDDNIDELDFDSFLSDNYYIIFKITNKGYSYQYNGYKKSQDKLQEKANLFLLITTIYYLSSWVFPNYDEFKKSFFKYSTLLKIESFYIKSILVIIGWEIIKKFYHLLIKNSLFYRRV